MRTNNLGHYYYCYIITQSGFRVCFGFYGLRCIQWVLVSLNTLSEETVSHHSWSYGRWHGTCLQPWEAQLASHESCDVSTYVCVIDAHSGLGSDLTLNQLLEFYRASPWRSWKMLRFLNRIWPQPWCSLRLSHRHTDTHTTTSKSLCSCNSRCWNFDLNIVSEFFPFQIFFFSFKSFKPESLKTKLCAFCRLPCAPPLPPSPLTLKTLLPNQTISQQINQSFLNRTRNNQTQRKSRWFGYRA